jgi:predicted regulator of Ras-like GTPase activity (Roadblock/LC7/MglB family)
MTGYDALLDGLTRVPGVLGAFLVSLEDGLVVADASVQDVDGAAVAALSARLATRVGRMAEVMGLAAPDLFELDGEGGALMAARAGEGLLLVALTTEGANLGLLRLALRQSAERVM